MPYQRNALSFFASTIALLSHTQWLLLGITIQHPHLALRERDDDIVRAQRL